MLRLFVVNLLFAQRIIRAAHPHSGWHPLFHWAFIAIYVLIVLTLIMIITSVIQSFYTLNANTKRIDRDIQLYGQTFYALVSFLPLPLVIGGLVIPRKTRLEKFGQGRWREKIAILATSAVLLCLGATFRVGVNYAGGKRPISEPANYQSKACFYVFNYVVEYIVVVGFVVVRVDRRFWVPNQSHKAGDYSRETGVVGGKEEGMNGNADGKVLTHQETRGENALDRAITTEEETFDDMKPEEVASRTGNIVKDVESRG